MVIERKKEKKMTKEGETGNEMRRKSELKRLGRERK